MRLFLVVVGLLLQATVHAQDSNSGGPPPFFIQDPSDGLCLAGEDFQKCSINTLFYVLGEPGNFQIHKRASDGTIDELDDGLCLAKKSCKDSDNAKTMDLKLSKCSHCGAKRWNILGDSNTGYVLTFDNNSEDGKEASSSVATCLIREKGTKKALTGPCDLQDTTVMDYTPVMLQFASASDIAAMSSPGARLVGAANEGDKKAIQALLKEGVDVNERDWEELTALIAASSIGNLDLIKYLVNEGADVNAADKDGVTALMEAAIMGHVKVVEFLLEKGAEVDKTAKSDVTALWLAASQGKTDCMKLLLTKGGASASVTRSDGITAVMTAGLGGHADAVKLLLEHGASVDATEEDGVTPLMSAAEGGSLDIVKMLVEYSKQQQQQGDEENEGSSTAYLDILSATGFTATIIAAAQGHTEVVEYLLDAGADANIVSPDNGVNAFMYAASNDYVEIMKVLLEKGHVDLEAKHTNGGTALLEAATSGANDAVKFLIEKGASYDFRDDDGVTPLMAVASQPSEEGQMIILNALKEKYPDPAALTEHINLFAYSGGSAVMFAAASGNAAFVKTLVEYGADVKAVAKATPEYLERVTKAMEDGTYQGDEPHVDGLTAVHVAAQGGYTETVELLVSLGVDVTLADEEGRTPLMLAIKGNHVDAASLLIKGGADANTSSTDAKGVEHNLLFDAIMVENVDFAKVLIENGADIYYKDEKDVTTLLQASHRGLTELVSSLVNKHKELNGKSDYLNDASDDGVSPLIAASSEGHVAAVQFLLAAGASPDSKDQDETTALMAASARGHLDVVKILLEGGAKINEQNRDGHTALMFAYNGKNQVETLWERFRQFSAEAEAGADDGGTGHLIKEALDSHVALVDLLLKSGADPKLKDKEGHIAKDFDYHPDTDAELLEKESKKEAVRDESRNEL